MKLPVRVAVVLCVMLALSLAAPGQRSGGSLPRAGPDAEKQILSVLEDARRLGETYSNVPVSDGRLLRLLTEATGARNVVELGTSTGLSGLWFCLALKKTGGRLTTFEYDAGRAAMARTHFKKAGVDQMVSIVEGDAHQTVSRLREPIDLLFIDADKSGYLDYLNKLLPLVRPGGLILAHNVDMAPDYRRAVTSNPALETVFYSQGEAMSITLKKR